MSTREQGLSVVRRALALLRSRDTLFLLALALGLVAPWGARPLGVLALPILGFIMTLSTMAVPPGVLRLRRGLVTPAIAGTALSYGLLSGLFLLASRAVPEGSYLSRGFVALALAPPAVAVIPFTEFFRGDRGFSLVGTVAAHLAGLGLAPLIALATLGSKAVRPGAVVLVLVELVLLPLALGRGLAGTRLAPRVEPWRGMLTNWGFFIVIYAMTGANRSLLLGDPAGVAAAAFVGVASTFGLALALSASAKALRLGHEAAVSVVLLGTLKNYGIASGVALELFGEKEAVPAVVCGTVMILYAVWLGRRRG